MIRTREEACSVLGIPMNATQEEIRKAYRNLVKQYHPDSGNGQDVQAYRAIVEAYEILSNEKTQPASDTTRTQTASNSPVGKVFGAKPVYHAGSNYASFERKYQAQKEAKAKEFDQKVEEFCKREEEYKKAMEAINSIRIAEALKAILKNYPRDN